MKQGLRVTDYEIFNVPPRWLFIKIGTSTGVVGWGESTLEGQSDIVSSAISKLFLKIVKGSDPCKVNDLWHMMYAGGFYRGGPVMMSALSGIDQALWDIKGKIHDTPISNLLGGPVRNKIEYYQWVGGDEPTEVEDTALKLISDGCKALKLNATSAFARIETPGAVRQVGDRVGRLRDAVGNDIKIGVDLHGRVTKAMLPQLIQVLEPHSPMFIEEPVLPEYNNSLSNVKARTSIPIATGERMYSKWDFKDVIQNGLVDIIQPDPSHAGGVTEILKIAAMAEAQDIALAPHSPLGPISLAAALQIDAICPTAVMQEFSQGIHYNDSINMADYLVGGNQFVTKDGFLLIPDDPGLGISIDEERVRDVESPNWQNPIWRHEDGSMLEW
jgi:galactonate dehydratase